MSRRPAKPCTNPWWLDDDLFQLPPLKRNVSTVPKSATLAKVLTTFNERALFKVFWDRHAEMICHGVVDFWMVKPANEWTSQVGGSVDFPAIIAKFEKLGLILTSTKTIRWKKGMQVSSIPSFSSEAEGLGEGCVLA